MATRRHNEHSPEPQPALRISNIVYGREKRNSRVYYLLDPAGGKSDKKVAESVVLARWRQRKKVNHSFSGGRLNPKIWRVLPKVLGPHVREWTKWTEDEIKHKLARDRSNMDARDGSLPGANVIKALLETCGPRCLSALIKRHNDPNRKDRYGTPDLFLFAKNTLTNRTTLARFVEVKKPEEPVSDDQREEIAFLRSLGLQARVLRLEERK